MMNKVLIVLPTLDRSGAEKQFTLLARGLPKSDFNVHVVALQRGGALEANLIEAGIPVTVLRKKRRLDVGNLRDLRRLIQSFQPNAIVSALFAANASVRLATWGLHPRPAILISERCVDSWKSSWQLWLDRRLSKRMDRLVANSASVAEFYQGLGIPGEKVHVIHNGVTPPPQPTLSRAELLQSLQLPEESLLVAVVGRLAPQKRVKDLLWAAQLLRQFNSRTHLLVIGDGPQRGELELYAQDVEVSQHVRFLGHRADAAALLNLCDVFWLGSEFEGQSNSLMEAMACGMPVVASHIPPNRELIEHGRTGWLVDVGDSAGFAQFTHQLLQQPDQARAMGDAARAHMQGNFNVERMVDDWAQLLREEIAARPHTQGAGGQ